MKILLAILLSMNASIALASPDTNDCDEKALKLTKAIIQTENMYDGKLLDTEARSILNFERDETGNVIQTIDIVWRVGPAVRISSKYYWYEGHCELISVEVKN